MSPVKPYLVYELHGQTFCWPAFVRAATSSEALGSPMRAEFDKFSDTYEDLLKDPIRDRFTESGHAFFHRRKLEVLLDFLKKHGLDPSRLSLLDVGCGKGDFLELSAPHFCRLAGCDPSQEMLQRIARKSIAVQTQTNPTKLPYDANQFDVVTAICVFHHVPIDARHALLEEMHRVLRPDGVLCLIEHNPFNPLTKLIVKRTPVDANAQLLTAGLSKRLARQAGFAVTRARYFLYVPEKLYARMGWAERLLAPVPFGGQYTMFCRKAS
jgi:ubiquinone/menaquinone biosynthesis C-methylase UbiE